VALDPPRFLDRRAGRNYTSDPMFALPREPEPVDPAEVETFSKTLEAKERYEQLHADERRRRAFRTRCNLVRNLQNETYRLDIDAEREWMIVDAQLEVIGRKLAHRKRVA
jgi:hypothetical protein